MSTPDLPLLPADGCGDDCGCGEAGDLECGLDPALAQLLEDAGLDPVEVEDIAHMALG
ncbi:nicotinate-nucleotide diphosphorylase (carboxylating), partial [Streptomyces sp. NPDC058231]